ncbi:MAG: hypothetical protein JW712_08425 [Dehalococcoidales bacterium]|nr:hypothetical protein [Dehalococcoidales bacterium]
MAVTEVTQQQYEEEGKRLLDEVEKRAGKSARELYEEKEKRLRDAIELRIPDRVPIVLPTSYLPSRWVGGGMTVADSYRYPIAWKAASRKMVFDLDPDIQQAQAGGCGEAISILGPKLFKYPGDGVGEESSHQIIEGENLKEDEYPLFLKDPGDFTLRYFLPRVWKELEPLAKLPPMNSLWGPSNVSAAFGDPEVKKAFDLLHEAGKKQQEHFSKSFGLDDDLDKLGFPAMTHGMAPAPFDIISDYLRGMAGTMIDLYRHPEELLQACDMMLERAIATGLRTLDSKAGNPKRVFSALHRGSDGFLNLKHFEKYYWSYLKKVIYAVTDAGLCFIPFYEGNWEQRLEYMLELPAGKTIARFAFTDMKKAKDVLKGHTCIMGGVPHSLLQTGTPNDVDKFCKELIETAGKDGGFVLSPSTGVTNEAKPENVKAMVESVKKYGRY